MNVPCLDPEVVLKRLGFRTEITLIREAAQRIKNGESLYKLYKPAGGLPLLAKGTATKVKKLLDQGKLGFLFNNHVEEEAVEEIVQGAGWLHDPPGLGSEIALINRLNELRPGLPRVEWNIEVLESVGIPVSEGLDLLVEHEVAGDTHGGDTNGQIVLDDSVYGN